MDERVIDLWKRTSLLMHRACQAQEAIYVQVLQPNQYHEGSWPMTAEQKEDVYSKTQEAGIVVRRLYPQLIDAGKELSDAGIRFSDQTMLFAEITTKFT